MIATSYALQEVAGKIVLQLKPGETQSFNWGLLSDSNTTITVSLSATGNGSQFLSFPKSVTLEPKHITYVTVNASIPSNYEKQSTLTPFLFATQHGQQGGPTVLNIQVEKIVTLNINGPPNNQSQGSVPEFPSMAGVVFAVATMSVIFVIVSKRSHNLFKL